MNAGVLEDSPQAIADFIHHTSSLDWHSLRKFLQERSDILDCLIQLHSYGDIFLPDALRKFFSLIPAPNERGQFLENLLDKFSNRYIQCNPKINMTKGTRITCIFLCYLTLATVVLFPSDTAFVICYSLILLSVDLTSPHVKNKMSKREFIRNLRRATQGVGDDILGHMYDNIYLSGHVATDYK